MCFKYVDIELAGRPYDFRDHPIHCPCKEDETVVIKTVWEKEDYTLFNVCDLEPSIPIIQAVLKAQGKRPMIVV